MVVTLPVIMALSWIRPVLSAALLAPLPESEPQAQRTEPTKFVDMITCPITGEEIPACCCPIKK